MAVAEQLALRSGRISATRPAPALRPDATTAERSGDQEAPLISASSAVTVRQFLAVLVVASLASK